MNQAHQAALLDHFRSLQLPLSESWLRQLLTHLPILPLHDLKTRVSQHFLASDIRQSLLSSPRLPQGPEQSSIVHDVVVQVTSVQEIGHSISSQLDAIEAYEESRKPLERRLIRLTAGDDDDTPSSTHQADEGTGDAGFKKKMCKVTLEDASGFSLYAIEQIFIPQISVDMSLGAKLLLRNVTVVHGVAILTPAKIEWIGGSYGTKVTRDEIKESLKARLTALPVMNTRDRQRAEAEQQQDSNGQEEWDVADNGNGNGDGARQSSTNYRGRGTRTRARGTRGTRARARGTSARARGR